MPSPCSPCISVWADLKTFDTFGFQKPNTNPQPFCMFIQNETPNIPCLYDGEKEKRAPRNSNANSDGDGSPRGGNLADHLNADEF